MKPLDPALPIRQQITLDAGPVVLVNLFTLAPDDEPAFFAAWTADAAYMKARSGVISTQLFRAVGDSPAYLNGENWDIFADIAGSGEWPLLSDADVSR